MSPQYPRTVQSKRISSASSPPAAPARAGSPAGGPGHAELAGAVAGGVGVERSWSATSAACGCGGGGGELGMQHAAVAGEGAAAPVVGHGTVVGDGLGDGAAQSLMPMPGGRAGGVQRQGTAASVVRQPRQHVLVRRSRPRRRSAATRCPGRGPSDSSICRRPSVQEAASHTTGSSPVPGGRPQRRQRLARHRRVAGRHALGLPGRAAAQAGDAGRHGQRRPRPGRRAARTLSCTPGPASRAEHACRRGGEDRPWPNIVPTHAGKYTASGAPCGVGRSARRTRRRAAPATTAARCPGPITARRQPVRRGDQPRRAAWRRRSARRARRPGGAAPVLRRGCPAPFAIVPASVGAQPLHQVAGVDLHRAGGLAHAVDRAGVDGVVVVVLARSSASSAIVPAGRGALASPGAARSAAAACVVRSLLGQTGSQ